MQLVKLHVRIKVLLWWPQVIFPMVGGLGMVSPACRSRYAYGLTSGVHYYESKLFVET